MRPAVSMDVSMEIELGLFTILSLSPNLLLLELRIESDILIASPTPTIRPYPRTLPSLLSAATATIPVGA